VEAELSRAMERFSWENQIDLYDVLFDEASSL
jgi:hypothetical protein